MHRGKKIILLAHCILNVNAKVEGFEPYQSLIKEVTDSLFENHIGIIQLPCPEMAVYGIKRWGHVKDQFDYKFFKDTCRDLLSPIMNQLESYTNSGYNLVGCIGIDGSPSCGVNLTCRSKDWRGEMSMKPDLESILSNVEMVNEKGVFMEVLENALNEIGLDVPFIGINEESMESSLSQVHAFISERADLLNKEI